ncbi:hypothetical protein ACLI1A_10320 [Flavobacterium sp. RHBU_3]|uniref:hypothetical protein n=1 Tax=Flavobacterium sp. RHBU_3 TaxID=3391184 RepID=UPI0039853435
MKQQRTNDSLHAGQIQLPFMANAPAELKEPRLKPETQSRADENTFKVVYPMINDQAFNQMMDNYRRFVDEYNMATEWENVDIANHNQRVELFLSRKATPLQKNYAGHFAKLNKELDGREYNAAADKVNAEHGPIIKKIPLHILKYTTEQFFQNFLHVYNRQLMQRNTEYMRLRVTEPTPLPSLKINSFLITQLQRADGVSSLKVCGKTVRNHRQHLEAAGVLVKSVFRGHTAAVEVEINPEILVVFDLRTNKLTAPVNQSVTIDERKTLPDNDEITGAYKEEYQEKNGATQPFVDKVSAKPTSSSHYRGISYRVTGCKGQNFTEGGAAAGENLKKNIAEELRQRIMHPQELAEALAAGEFNHYVPIDIRILKAAAYDGMMSAAEYRELIIQELLKQSAKIWINATPYAGSWKNAINHWMQHKFLNFKGEPFGPANVFDYLEEYRWRLEQARRWFSRASVDVKPLYPSDYFDTRRKTKAELGFEGTVAMWKRKLQYDEKRPIEKRKQEKKAEKRLQRISDNHKLNHQVKRYLGGKVSLIQLCEYVHENLPKEFYEKLPQELTRRLAESGQSLLHVLK